MGRNAQNLKQIAATDQKYYNITIRAPVGANKVGYHHHCHHNDKLGIYHHNQQEKNDSHHNHHMDQKDDDDDDGHQDSLDNR